MAFATMFVVMFVFNNELSSRDSFTDTTQPGERTADDEHPSTLEPKVPPLPNKFEKNPCAERNECDADDSAHPSVESIGDRKSERDRERAESKDNNAMSNGVGHRQRKATLSGVGGAAQIGDGGDVIPIDPMAQAEAKCGE